MADLVPVRRGSKAPARREEPQPQPRNEVYAPLPSPFAEFDDLWNRMVSRLFAPIEERERVGVVRHRARRSGSFEYRASLPAGIDAGNIDARFDNGLLTVRVPRPERSKAHRIKIN